MKIVFATGNPAKLVEIREIVKDLGIEVVTMKEEGFTGEIDETGTTFMENALIKARTVAKALGEVTMSDDSGLVVDALGGEPGIYSARWMGEDTSYHIKNNAIIDRLGDLPAEKRTARFVCAMACVFPDGRELTVEETFRRRVRTGSATIRFSTCRRGAARRRSSPMRRKMQSATAEKP